MGSSMKKNSRHSDLRTGLEEFESEYEEVLGISKPIYVAYNFFFIHA